jgi:flagellar basal body-associated protein FliL
MAKKSKKSKINKKTPKNNKIWIFVAVVIIALAAIFALQFSGSTPNVGGTTSGQNQGSQTKSIESTGDVCKRDSECFLVNCKNTPNDVKCVNATHEELYYKDCDNNWNNVVPAIQNALTCGCAQGICKVK